MQWKRIWKSKGFYVALAIQVFAYFYAHMDAGTFWRMPLEYFRDGDLLYFYMMPRTYGLCGFLLPMVAALPAAGLVAEDYETGFLKYTVHRQGRLRYAVKRMARSFAAGFLASLAGSLLYLLFIMIACPWEEVVYSWREVLAHGSFRTLAETAYGLPLIADGIFRFAYAAGVWGLIAFGVTCLIRRRHAGVALTFLLFDALSALLEVSDGTRSWSPSRIPTPDLDYAGSPAVPLLQQSVYLAAAVLFGALAARSFFRRQEG